MKFSTAVKLILVTAPLLVVSFFAIQGTTDVGLSAFVTGAMKNKYAECVLSFSEINNVTITESHINTDDTKDGIIKINDAQNCGSGGCIHELCVTNKAGEAVHVNFGFAADLIEVEDTVTNGMHDIRLNKNENLKMVWDGTQYKLRD